MYESGSPNKKSGRPTERPNRSALTCVNLIQRVVWFGCVVGCQPEPETQGDLLTWHGQIKPLVERSCAGCHTEGSVAPFTLETYDDVVAWLPLVVESVRDRTMPPWLAEPDCNNYVGDFSLSEEERESILAWAWCLG